MKHSTFSIYKRLKSFSYAFNGFRILIKEEHNARIHLLAAVLAIVLSLVLNSSKEEWIIVFILIGWIISTELINTAIEILCDFVHPEKHPQIKKIKDLSAAAVLFISVLAIITGGIIFIPRLFEFL